MQSILKTQGTALLSSRIKTRDDGSQYRAYWLKVGERSFSRISGVMTSLRELVSGSPETSQSGVTFVRLGYVEAELAEDGFATDEQGNRVPRYAVTRVRRAPPPDYSTLDEILGLSAKKQPPRKK